MENFISENANIIGLIVGILSLVFAKFVSRKNIFKIGLPFVKSFAFIVKNINKTIPKKFNINIQESIFCTILFCIEKWSKLARILIEKENK